MMTEALGVAGESYNGKQVQSQRTTLYHFILHCLVWGLHSASRQSPHPPIEWHLEMEQLGGHQ